VFAYPNPGLNVLICGAVLQPFLKMLASSGITFVPEISGAAEELLQAYFKGTLSQARFLMPGCKRGKVSGGVCRGRSRAHSERDRAWSKETATRPKMT
jgi:predicted Fe-Mo cluster-binding NifX family protein